MEEMNVGQDKRFIEVVSHVAGKGITQRNAVMKAILYTAFSASIRAFNEMGQRKFMNRFRKGGKKEFARLTSYIVTGKPQPNFKKKK